MLRRRPSRLHRLVLLGLAALVAQPLVALPASASAPMIGVDRLRTSWDRNEPGLAPSIVGSSSFGQLFSTPVEGQVYAQPVTTDGRLVVATEANQVYGLDPATGVVGWQTALGRPWHPSTLGCGDLTPTIGVTSTPVYDADTHSVYLTSKVDDGADAQHPHWYMHALDTRTGIERAGWPVRIEGAPSNDPAHPFNPLTAMQRPGLLLLGGVVYAAFASHCDYGPYVGYVVGIDAAGARISTMWASESGTSYDEGGIWQSGAGLVSDGPNSILLATGNGLSPAPGPGHTPPATLGESVVRLRVGADGNLTATDFFSPANNLRLDQNDADLGAGGPLALPDGAGSTLHPHLLVQAGKDGRVYLLDRDELGGMGQGAAGTDAALGVTGPYGSMYGKAAYFGGGGGYVYVVEAGGYLRAHALRRDASGAPALVSVGTSAGTFAFSSGSPVVTSVGSDPSTALVWVVKVRGSDGSGAELQAYDAVPDSTGILRQRFARPLGTASKFSSVATDGGRVYVGTRDGHVWGFGAPTTAGVAGTGTDFAQVAVGATATRTVRLTATRNVTLTALRTSPPFSVPALAAPLVLSTGQSTDVVATFAPTSPGQVGGSLSVDLRSGTTAETATLDLRGYGTRDGLLVTPAALDFGELATGAAKQLSVNVTNVGTTPAALTGVQQPLWPFSVVGLPEPGYLLAPQASLAISVLAQPTAPGALRDALVLSADRGDPVTVPLTASAVAGAPSLQLPEVVDFGEVALGQAVVRDFPITNTGNAPMTVTKAKPPAGAFTAPTPLAEGLVVSPGDTIHQSVTFTPTAVGSAQESYLITADDGTGMRTVLLRGTGIEDPITVEYERLGGASAFPPSVLGNPLSPQRDIPGGRMQAFTRGNIYWSPATGAHDVLGAVLGEYLRAGGPTGVLGFPITDELPGRVAPGRYNDFAGSGGSIYWSPTTGAHAVWGSIRQQWLALGGETGVLGYPLTDELGTPDGTGRYNHFAGNGSVYWTPATGAHAVYGQIRERWAALGWETGPLGYPVSDELGVPGGRRNEFSRGGLIDWSPSTGAHAVLGAIRQRWEASGAERGPLGLPVTDELGTPDGRGRYNHFAGSGGASVYWTPQTGAHGVYGGVRRVWSASGWELGRYGYPVTDQYPVRGGQAAGFERGTITAR